VARSSVPIEAVAWQLTDVTAFGLTDSETAARVYFVTGGEAFGGHLAFAQILWAQRNWLLKAVGWLLTVPPFCWLGSIGYALVARFRHRLPGGTPACAIAPQK
jgi:predicted DCC family thiol-disulfide oxidoreductase YuxK